MTQETPTTLMPRNRWQRFVDWLAGGPPDQQKMDLNMDNAAHRDLKPADQEISNKTSSKDHHDLVVL